MPAVYPDARGVVHQIILEHYFPLEQRYPIDTVGLTTTWLGPPYLDFGLPGVTAMMVYLGALMGIRAQPLKASEGYGVCSRDSERLLLPLDPGHARDRYGAQLG